MFLQPADIVATLGLPTGATVADFGTGTGTYALAAAKSLNGSGRVYAVDVQKDLLVRLKASAVQAGIANLEVIWGDCEKAGGTNLRDQSADFVILANVLFQAPEKAAVLKEARRVLKPAGRGKLLLIDWSGSFKNMGPTREHVVLETDARRIAEGAGFIYERTVDAGAYHYGLLFHT